jgi:hypothetical protein
MQHAVLLQFSSCPRENPTGDFKGAKLSPRKNYEFEIKLTCLSLAIRELPYRKSNAKITIHLQHFLKRTLSSSDAPRITIPQQMRSIWHELLSL